MAKEGRRKKFLKYMEKVQRELKMAEIKLTNNGISAVINYHGAELKSLNKEGKEYMINNSI